MLNRSDTYDLAALRLIGLMTVLVLGLVETVAAAEWTPLAKDGVHDPKNESLRYLQQPNEALGVLPKDSAGNKVDWIRALQEGYIKPRFHLNTPGENETLDTEILMKDTREMPYVLFPHKPHTEWLACENCHETIFKSKAGSTQFNMLDILEGKYCGQCHGAVAFPLTECDRCHSVPLDFK